MLNHDLCLRLSQSSDLTELLEMIIEPLVAAGLFPDGPQQRLEYLQPTFADRVGPVFVAIDSRGRLHGGGRIELTGVSYFVQLKSQGQGIGRWLASALLSAFAEKNATRQPTLQIHRDNIASIKVAEHLGFRFSGIVANRSGVLRYTR